MSEARQQVDALLKELNVVQVVEDRHLLQFMEVRTAFGDRRGNVKPDSPIVPLFNLIFTLLRKQWNDRINVTARNAAVPGVVGCDLEDMLALADDSIDRLIWFYGERKGGVKIEGKVPQFNTLFYTHFHNQVKTLYRRYGVIDNTTYRLLIPDPTVENPESLREAIRQAYRGRVQIHGYQTTPWVKSEAAAIQQAQEMNLAPDQYRIVQRERNRRRLTYKDTVSLQQLLNPLYNQKDSLHSKFEDNREGFIGTIDDSAHQRLEFFDVIDRHIIDEKIKKLLVLLYSGESKRDTDTLCKELECEPRDISRMLRTASKALQGAFK
jgi:hypothetical protein